jgi:P27 family predicted phage terminase small subunit
MRGRKPKPTLLKKLHGNPGQRKLNADEPQPTAPLVEAPPQFNDDMRAIWDYALANAPPGLLGTLDRSVLSAWVVACSIYSEAVRQYASRGELLLIRLGPPPARGEADMRPFMQNPLFPVINKQAAIMMKAAEQLGFSPVSRARVQTSGTAPIPLIPTTRADPNQAVSLDEYLASAPEPPRVH